MKTVSSTAARRAIVQFSAKHFSERLNHCLDETDAPSQIRERAIVLSKMLDIPKPLAWGLLEGHQQPDAEMLQRIADEFEVDPKWLSGEK